jgi:hypothetical protein
MLPIPARHAHFIFAIVQAGVSTGFATAVATFNAVALTNGFLTRWLTSWAVAWAMVVPIVLLAAPFIQAFAARMTTAGSADTERD